MVDGLRVMLRLGAALSQLIGVPGWRKHQDWFRKGKKLLRKIQKTATRTEAGEQARRDLYRNLIDHVREIADRALNTIAQVKAPAEAEPAGGDLVTSFEVDQLVKDLIDFQVQTLYVCQLAERRVLRGETIPNREKVFSLFEPHTELINRGKCPNPIEFGRRVVIVEDRVGFIVECRVLDRGQQEAEVLVPMMKQVQARLNKKIRSASFDRGFYTPENRKELQKIVDVACLPKKGKVSGAALAEESEVKFRAARRRHPGIESAIHALRAGNGLDRCRDRTEEGYKRYVALAALGRNLQTLGRLVLKKQRRRRAA